MGKESCFLPQSASFPSFSPKCNATLPHKSSPSIYRQGFLPLQMQNPHKMLPYKFLFFMLFLSIYCFVFVLFCFFSISFPLSFLFSPKTWNSSPKRKNYSPAFGANNRRIEAPGASDWGVNAPMAPPATENDLNSW